MLRKLSISIFQSQEIRTRGKNSKLDRNMASAENQPNQEQVPMTMIYLTLALSLIGLAGNAFIILATLVTRNLQNRCNILICILAIADLAVCIYLIQLRVLMFQKWYWKPNNQCFIMSICGLFALNIQAGMGLILGVDRLLAVSIPLRYSKLPKVLYVCLILLVLIYAALVTLNGYVDSSDTIIPICLPPTAYNPRSRKIWISGSLSIAILVIIVYGAAHIKCHRLNKQSLNEQSIEKIKHLLNSLSLIMGIYFTTWFLTVVALFVTELMPLTPPVVVVINQQLAWLVIINASTNFFIYFWRASEYRKSFVFLLTFGQNLNPSTPSTHPINKPLYLKEGRNSKTQTGKTAFAM